VSVPYGAAPDTITYNATLAESAGITPLLEGYDWDAFFDWLLAAQDKLPDDVWAIDSPANNPDLLLAYIGSHGYKVYDGEKLGFPKELLVAWFTEWNDLNAAGAMVPPDMLSEEPGAHELSYFAAGRSLASQRPANALGALQSGVTARGSEDVLATQLYPVGPEGVGDFVPVNSLSMAATCDNAPLAAAFADFFVNDPEAGAIFASDNGAATNATILQAQVENANATILQAQVENANTPAPVRALLQTFQKVNDRGSVAQTFPARFQSRFTEVHKRLMMEVLFGSATPQEAADTFFSEAE
jgi:multiple sugar transport system substrate-binding protein